MKPKNKLESQDNQIREEEAILNENEATCFQSEFESAEVGLTTLTAERLRAIAENATQQFYNYDSMQWLACLIQRNFSYIESLRRWAKISGVRGSISKLTKIGEGSTDGFVYNASLHGIEDLILLKTPKEYWRDVNISHEFFIAAMFTNGLRRWIPNFMFIYGLFKCSRPNFVNPNDKTTSTFCTHTRVSDLRSVLSEPEKRKLDAREKLINLYINQKRYNESEEYIAQIEDLHREYDVEMDVPVNYLVIENIPGGLTLERHINDNEPAFTEILGYFVQLAMALDVALNVFDFCHYDLHASNIMMRDLYDEDNLTFIPIQYSDSDGSIPEIAEYFLQTEYIATIIDYGRSHVRWYDFDSKTTKHFGDHLSNVEKTGVYPDRSRPAHDLYKFVGSTVYEIFYKYRLPIPYDFDSRGKTDDEIRSQIMAYNIPDDLFDDLVRVLSFFPFFKESFGEAINDESLKAPAIEFILQEREGPGLMSIGDKWAAADTWPFKMNLHKMFFQHLKTVLPEEVGQILFLGKDLPTDAVIYSCEFNDCQPPPPAI
ncbi:MAG: hypothetical protein H0X02_11220 [Nitrosomonas sp.]|nr:hypothetical protein [Nitrosomonas sp.]